MSPSFAFQKISFFALSVMTIVATAVSVFAQSASTVAENLEAVPYDTAAVLQWEPAYDDTGVEASFYLVGYGENSVEEGLAEEYDETVVTPNGAVSFSLQGLENGVRYYTAVKAVFSDGNEGANFSEEVVFTPSSAYGPAPITAANDDISPVVTGAMALTKNLVKVTFSEDVDLDSIVLPALSFVVVESLDSSVLVPVESVEYKVDYEGEGVKEVIHKDTLFIALAEELKDAETEYVLTASASVVDMSGNPVESGVTDYARFEGTDRTEIPAAEKPLSTPENTDPVDNTPPEPPTTADTTAPENVTNFRITSVPRATDYALDLRWDKSSSDDVAFQNVYRRENGSEEWKDEAFLSKDTEQYDSQGLPETEPSYKITATDLAGNVNSGSIQSIRLPALASTGAPLALLALGTSFSFLGARKWKKKG